eukprot:TRINITY_DN21877_c0_g1_i1.p1 TRINITY_DN21877_c0_g1~~TRINITY_DN21877_c0_g1_i1.p1  ORF type:complete len:163 (+),score=18.33 TRINITY_DN21877_c0_g1_i1:43-489(+)
MCIRDRHRGQKQLANLELPAEQTLLSRRLAKNRQIFFMTPNALTLLHVQGYAIRSINYARRAVKDHILIKREHIPSSICKWDGTSFMELSSRGMLFHRSSHDLDMIFRTSRLPIPRPVRKINRNAIRSSFLEIHAYKEMLLYLSLIHI